MFYTATCPLSHDVNQVLLANAMIKHKYECPLFFPPLSFYFFKVRKMDKDVMKVMHVQLRESIYHSTEDQEKQQVGLRLMREFIAHSLISLMFVFFA